MKRNIAISVALILALMSASTAFAAQNTVPVSSLQPAVQLEKPQLTGVGGKLIFSDSPETFSAPGAFYRDTAEGEFRVFWHHQNAAEHTLTVGVAVTNTSGEPINLSSKGSGLGTNIYVDVAGQTALADFMRTQDKKQFLADLVPGETYYFTAPTDSNITNSGLVQFIASTKKGNHPAQVTVTTLSYDVKPIHPELAAILPGDSLTRGTFPHFDRVGTIRYNTSTGNGYLSIDSDAVGPWKGNEMPGEYEEGWDAVDGKTVINNGNYGVMYRLSTEIINSYHHPSQVSLYLNPAGGYGHYAVKWNKEIFQSEYLSYENAWNIVNFKLNPNGGEYKSEMSLTGGSSGPQVIYFTNQPK
ncbi:hypothetical protein M5X11_24180 [Paenibacillus alginolyticus]|uniref:Uncharacterized protein n=1 Tax=Paenibacillus alginolyticus TaxID=59839 RepID=A0ABT4GM19_9BACL|nr:hypothetical protein [Paenibacillus alginolyticus]MCY9667983.1 hypothetical protein [Paenibacillus alginolyticus]MCY9697245.1 hypothetical protein [Paenibacillus alginolyticus]MEC0145492.1 hypothetical protein [Paenibacillus alginolyticus]